MVARCKKRSDLYEIRSAIDAHAYGRVCRRHLEQMCSYVAEADPRLMYHVGMAEDTAGVGVIDLELAEGWRLVHRMSPRGSRLAFYPPGATVPA